MLTISAIAYASAHAYTHHGLCGDQFEDDSFLPKMCGTKDESEAMCMENTAKAILAARAEEEDAY